MEYNYIDGSILCCAGYCFPYATRERIEGLLGALHPCRLAPEELAAGLEKLVEGGFLEPRRRGFSLTRKARKFLRRSRLPYENARERNRRVSSLFCRQFSGNSAE